MPLRRHHYLVNALRYLHQVVTTALLIVQASAALNIANILLIAQRRCVVVVSRVTQVLHLLVVHIRSNHIRVQQTLRLVVAG